MSSPAPPPADAALKATNYVLATERHSGAQYDAIRKLFAGFVDTARTVRGSYHLRSRALLRRARLFERPETLDKAQSRDLRLKRHEAYTRYVAELRIFKAAVAAIPEPQRVVAPGPAVAPTDPRAAACAAACDVLADVSDDEEVLRNIPPGTATALDVLIDEACRANDDLTGTIIDAGPTIHALVRQRLNLARHELAGLIAAAPTPEERIGFQRQLERLGEHVNHANEGIQMMGENDYGAFAPSFSAEIEKAAIAGLPAPSRALFLRDVGDASPK